MAVFIEEFTFNNYRSCIRTRIQPDKRLSCLIGLNGSGKSTILNAIRLLKAIAVSNSRFPDGQLFSSSTRLKATFNVDGKRIFMKAEVSYSQSDKGDDEVLGHRTEWNFAELTKVNKWIYVPIGRSYDSYGYMKMSGHNPTRYRYASDYKFDYILTESLRNKASVNKAGSALTKINEFIRGISYYSASQFTDPSKCPASFELDEERGMRRPIRGNDHTKFMFDIYATFKNRSSTNDWNEFIDIVGNNGLRLFDQLDFKEVKLPESRYQVISGGRVTRQKVNRILIVPSVSIGGAKLSLGQLSEGTFKTLALLFYIVSDRSQLLLVEEPEVCVHHGLLTSIVELIKSYSSSKQVIFSTHSDFVLDRLPPDQVYIVTRRPKLGTSVRPVTKALSKTNFRALKSYLEENGNLGEYWRHGGFENGI